MILIVGLGNPEEKFKKTRHNFGFLVLDKLQKESGFPVWKKNKNANCLYSKGSIFEKEIMLIKPLTYMNESGKAVKHVLLKNSIKPENLFVIHDDIDLLFGKIKISEKSGSAGHKGIESIIKEIKTKDFTRFRIGIQPELGKPQNPKTFVLRNFNKSEEKTVNEVIYKTIEAVKISLKDGVEKAMNRFN